MTRFDPAAISPGESLLTAIDHVGIAVRDLDAAIEFYTRTFGLSVTHREENPEQGVAEAMLGVGDGAIQLLAPLDATSPIARFLDKTGPGVQQIAFRVRDVTTTSALLRDRGIRLLYDQPKRGTAGSRINFIHPKDCGGVLVELVEVPRTSSPPSQG